jgi:hypothetical protein
MLSSIPPCACTETEGATARNRVTIKHRTNDLVIDITKPLMNSWSSSRNGNNKRSGILFYVEKQSSVDNFHPIDHRISAEQGKWECFAPFSSERVIHNT